MTRLKTLLVCQWFPPEPVVLPLSIATALQARGHTVDVLTGIPNYPTGEVSRGYRWWHIRKEKLDGLVIHRTPLIPSHDSSAAKRMLNYLSWAVSSSLVGMRAIRRADVALVYSSPATAATAPAIWRSLARTPFVLIIQDLWPDSVTASAMARPNRTTKAMEWLLHRFVSWTYRRAAHIITISPGMADKLVTRGVSRQKISLIYNWAPSETRVDTTHRAAARRNLGISDDDFVVSYAGNHGTAQGLGNVVAAASMLDREGTHVVFVLAGDGVETDRLVAAADSAGCTNIRFPGRLDASEMESLRSAADVQLVSLIKNELFAITMPSKVQSILASGQPFIVIATGDAAEVADLSSAGWSVPPGDPQALAAAVRVASTTDRGTLGGMSAAGSAYYEANMSQAIGAERLDRVLRSASRLPTATIGEDR